MKKIRFVLVVIALLTFAADGMAQRGRGRGRGVVDRHLR